MQKWFLIAGLAGFLLYRQYKASDKLGITSGKINKIDFDGNGRIIITITVLVNNPTDTGLFFTQFSGLAKFGNQDELQFETSLQNYLPPKSITPVQLSITANAGTAINTLLEAIQTKGTAQLVINGSIKIGAFSIPYKDKFNLI